MKTLYYPPALFAEPCLFSKAPNHDPYRRLTKHLHSSPAPDGNL